MVYNFEQHTVLGAELGVASTHYIQPFNAFLNKNLDQNIPKNEYFLLKNY